MQAGNAHFDGVSFHCYEGSVSQQGEFSSRYPNKVCLCIVLPSCKSYLTPLQEIYMTGLLRIATL